MRELNNIEILAPAGSFDSLVAAVRCGADAVYLGSKSLNARRNAGNFDDAELERAVRYCHGRGVSVYQTLNILLYEHEIEEAVRAVETAARLGIDGILTQDLAMLRIARSCAPELPVYASTQMAVHNLAGALQAQEMGFKRVVLAREMSRAEIARVTAGVDIETEVFVHGALCMSVSGQCYLSSMVGERSGNRGLCAQPCRLPFKAEGGVEHGLSLKDLTLVDRVAELRELGVTSLKIEGRMKRPEYVAAAVTSLRAALAGEAVDFDTLRSVFSRSGFTSAYYDGQIDKRMFGIRQKEDATSAKNVLGDLARLYEHEQPVVDVSMRFTAQGTDAPAELSVRDGDGNSATAVGEHPQPAQSAPLTAEKAQTSLAKTGGTPFALSAFEADIAPGLFLPAAALNAMRRDALDDLIAQREALRPHGFADTFERKSPSPISGSQPKLRARLTGAQLSDEIAEICERLILPLSDIKNVLRRGIVQGSGKIVAEIPRIIFSHEQQVAAELAELKELGIGAAWAGNLGAVRLAAQAGMQVHGGWSLNVFNRYALDELAQLGVADCELSFELSLPRARELGGEMPVGLLAYGYLPLMALRSCPIKAARGCGGCSGQPQTLTDRIGVKFPVICSGGDVSELLNAVPLHLGDRLAEFSGFDFLTLYFTTEGTEECREILQQYLTGRPLDGARAQKTRGLYYRNVQ